MQSLHSKEKFVVLGYYGCNNLGDDVFEYIFTTYFKRYWPDAEYVISNTHDIDRLPEGTTAVIFGGGDVIIDYFIDKLKYVLSNTPNGDCIPIYAISVGIPYRSIIEKCYLDNFDYIIHRIRADQEQLLEKYGKNRVSWFPDLSYLLTHYNPVDLSLVPQLENEFQSIFNKTRTKKIGVFLSRTIYNKDNPSGYETIVGQLSNFLISLAREKIQKRSIFKCFAPTEESKYEIFLFPFCDSPKDTQDDRLINRDIYQKINDFDPRNPFDNVHLIEKKPKMEELLTVFSGFYATICTRFHAHMFSVMAQTPVLSIYTTRKVHNILTEFNLLDYSVKMEVDDTDHPLALNPELLVSRWHRLLSNYDHYKKDLEVMNETYCDLTEKMQKQITNILFYKPKTLAKQAHLEKEANLKGRLIAERIVCKFGLGGGGDLLGDSLVDQILCTTGFLKTLIPNTDDTTQDLSELISYTLTGNRGSIYHWGLKEKVLTDCYNLLESCAWILCDYNKYDNETCVLLTNSFPRCERKFNTRYINANLYKGYHRSGWNYVLQHLDKLHAPNGVMFDSYADKTFGWEEEFLRSIKVVPYTNAWVGVFHHTPHTEYSENNMVNVFKKASFLHSLETCKGLIVFSAYMADWLKQQLCILNFVQIPVLKLFHPSEEVDPTFQFNFRKFNNTYPKKVIQIGGWLRNSYAIYELPKPTGFDKYVLKWIGMDNYFVDDGQLHELQDTLSHLGCGNCGGSGGSDDNCCGHIIKKNCKTSNKYVRGLTELIKKNHESVTVLEMTPNEEFDRLLTECVVFINLVDASAVNTILECIMRNTPICVNPLPAVKEYLGEDYPLYYTTLDEAARKIGRSTTVQRAHLYLKVMDKTRFTVEHFLKKLIESDLYQNL